MRKKLLACFLLAASFVNAFAQGEVIIGTNTPVGDTFKFYMTLADATSKVYVDWGDGVKQEAVLSGWSSTKNTEGTLKNDTIIVYGDFTSIDIESRKVNVLGFKNQNNLTQIAAKDNELTYEGLDFTGAPNIKNLDLRNNRIKRLDVRSLSSLEIFQANNNPDLSTVLFADGSTSLSGIYMADCDITHFYPVSLPKLDYLDLGNASLTDLELGENYPNLKSLTVSNSKYLTSLDVTKLTKLNKLDISGTGISEINLVNNPELITLDARNTKIEKLDLSKNANVTTLLLANTKISKLNTNHLAALQTINMEGTLVKRIDLSNCRFVRDVNMRATGIQFLDLHGAIGTNRLNKLDIRDCADMTPQSLNFTFMAMPPHTGNSYGTNVYIQGSNGETAQTDLLEYDEENYYVPDVKGDGSASMDSINIIQQPSDVAYTLTQVANDGYFASWNEVTAKALPGFPLKVSAELPEGKELVGVEINGKLYGDSIFVVSSDATIKPVFKVTGNGDYIRLTVPSGSQQQYVLSVSEAGKEVTIDWGNGEKVPVQVNTTPTTVNGTTAGTQVTIYGAITGADFSSYPHINADNKITAIDLSHNGGIRQLSTYMNFIEKLNVSHLIELDTLDCAYNDLAELDIRNNTKLVCLRANGNYLETIDLTNAPELQFLEVNNNTIDELDLSKNPKLTTIIAGNNSLTDIDVANMPELRVLRLSANVLKALDIDNNPKLVELDVAKNALTSLNVSQNKELVRLMVNDNKLAGLNLTGLANLSYLNIGDNKWDACTLNDIYYSLSEYMDSESTPTGFNLFTRGDVAEKYNDAGHAESKIATEKGWTVNYEGDGTGCDLAYITIKTPDNGSLKVFTTTDRELASGTKVNKNTELKVVTTPADGYTLQSVAANGEEVTDGKFTITEATTVVAEFTVQTGIEGMNETTTTVQGGNRELLFVTTQPTCISVYTTGGTLVFSEVVMGQKTIGMPSGVYIVKTQGIAKSVAVK